MKNIFGKFNIVDIIIVLGVIIALIIGIATTKHFRQTADKQIEATSPITFQVFLRGVTVTGQEFPVKSGDNTFITIRNVPYTELSVVEGMQFERGYLSPYMCTNTEKMTAELDNAYILITDKKISTMAEILPVLEQLVKVGGKMLIIADDVEGEALTALILNKLNLLKSSVNFKISLSNIINFSSFSNFTLYFSLILLIKGAF